MIPVSLQPEPINFPSLVREPGRSFLRLVPAPTSEQFRGNAFWKRCLPDLKRAYSEVCAYSACWIPSSGSVDHFSPVSVRPDLAYEWSNYRLATQKINSYKGGSTNILDPFYIKAGWFILNFDNLFIEPGNVPPKVSAAVRSTIDALRLNTDDDLLRCRFTIVSEYRSSNLTFAYIEKYYPFIAFELDRQGMKI